LIGQVYFDKTKNKELIYSGTEWLARQQESIAPQEEPQDPLERAPEARLAAVSSGSNPSGAHSSHSAYDCQTCHKPHGFLIGWFDPNGPAFIKPTPENPAPPPPSYDRTSQTCSNVACHGVPLGTFSYYFPGGDGTPELKTVAYGGYVTTPGWYSVGQGCFACHGNPPSATGGWHRLDFPHVRGVPSSQDCSFCHPDASGVGVGTAITNPALHRNGVIDVQGKWNTRNGRCFGCH
jgi:hypothetical protein